MVAGLLVAGAPAGCPAAVSAGDEPPVAQADRATAIKTATSQFKPEFINASILPDGVTVVSAPHNHPLTLSDCAVFICSTHITNYTADIMPTRLANKIIKESKG